MSPSSPDSHDRQRAGASTGRRGEDIAARYLVKHGCTVVARNWHAKPGEVDIVAWCPPAAPTGSGEQELAFVEVRTRHGRPGLAEESISPHKATSMASAAYAYMTANGIDPERTPWRLDLVAIAMHGPTITSINWVKNAIDENMLDR